MQKSKLSDKEYLQLAIQQAKKSVEEGGFPAGAVLVKNGEIIAEGISIGFLLHDPTSHAETASIRSACKKLETIDLSGSTLYASLQPCLMCFSVSSWAQVSRIVYGCKKTEAMVKKMYYEGLTDLKQVNKENNHQIDLEFIPDFEQEMLNLVKQWEELITATS